MLVRRFQVAVVKKEVSTQTEHVTIVSEAVAAALVAGSSNTTSAVQAVEAIPVSRSSDGWLERMNNLYSRYVLEILECYNKSFFEFSYLDIYVQMNIKKLMRVMWIYDNDFVYKAVIPCNYWKRLSVSERIRLCFERYTDYDNIYFRFLAFALNDEKVINSDDVFVLFERRNVDRIVELFVKHDCNEKLLNGISNVLSVDYGELILKCQSCRNLLNSTRAVFHH
jgi:hypothetical protein